MRKRKRLSQKTDKRRRRRFRGRDGKYHWASGKGKYADRDVAAELRYLKSVFGVADRNYHRRKPDTPKKAIGENIMTVDELRASGYALAEAIKAHTDAVCKFLVEAQVDYQREFSAVSAKEAAKLLSLSTSAIYTMVKDGRLARVNERIPLWSIDEMLRKTPAERRKKPDAQTYKPRKW